jgi:hypothetical protein
MSHFVVLVIGDNVEQQLAPYHEFECTGRDDQYVVDIDITEEVRNEYLNDTVLMVVNGQTGERVSKYDEEVANRQLADDVVVNESEHLHVVLRAVEGAARSIHPEGQLHA